MEGAGAIIRIYIGEADKIGHTPLYEKIVLEARSAGMAGATVIQGVMGFGRNSRIHSAKLLRLSEDLPLVIEIIDRQDRIEAFLPVLQTLFKNANCGGLITTEPLEIISYAHSTVK